MLCTYFNRAWLEFTGRPLEAETGNGWIEGVHSEDRNQLMDTYTKFFERREHFQIEYRMRRSDGEYRWILDSGVPRFGGDGVFAGFIGSAIDVTEHKLAEEALSMVSRKLIEAHEEERAWLARELHDDIAQRLTVLAMNLGQLSRNPRCSAAEFREGIGQAMRQASELGSDMQALSHRLHSSKLEYLGLESAASSFCRELADLHNVEVKFHSDTIPSTLSQDIALCVFRVLQEALLNALKHSGSRRFQVSITGKPDALFLSVLDEGIGFDISDAPKGRGLGLVSMKERMKLVAGKLRIDSQPGKGTTIHVEVPLASKAVPARSGI
jgi:PAS domain S-box-containing protein